jgi:hypothetical protein
MSAEKLEKVRQEISQYKQSNASTELARGTRYEAESTIRLQDRSVNVSLSTQSLVEPSVLREAKFTKPKRSSSATSTTELMVKELLQEEKKFYVKEVP